MDFEQMLRSLMDLNCPLLLHPLHHTRLLPSDHLRVVQRLTTLQVTTASLLHRFRKGYHLTSRIQKLHQGCHKQLEVPEHRVPLVYLRSP